MRHLTVALTLMALLCLGSNALAVNDATSLVLHAVETSFGLCTVAPCPDAAVDIGVGPTYAFYLLINNHENVAGVQTAFDWPTAWPVLFGLWDCQGNQVNGTTPTAPGPQTGTIASAFDCVTGPEQAVIGRIHVSATTEGCFSQVMSSFPFGNHVVSCQNEVTEVDMECWGSVCAGTGAPGVDACPPCEPIPVEPTTWGSIKAQYN
jgi:hypothetical protein